MEKKKAIKQVTKKLVKTIENDINNKTVKNNVSELRTFLMRGNIIDMAVGVIIGTAFGKIVTSLVNDILMPFLGIILGGLDFTNLSIKIEDEAINYGLFLQNIIDFLIIAVSIFIFIKVVSKIMHVEKKEEKPKKTDEVILLEEIRDLLKK